MRMWVLVSLFLLVPAQAAHAERDQFNPRDTVVVEPHRAYIFYRTNVRGTLNLMRDVGAAAREATRVGAFDVARADYRRRLARYERTRAQCESNPAPGCPDRPAEPSLETFPDPTPEGAMLVSIVWQPRFTGGDEGSSYLMAVEPGAYVIYGNMMLGNNGFALGVCLCMGSVRFEARPGQITDLGEINFRRPDERTGRRPWSPDVVPYVSTMTLPPRLAGLPRVAAEFHAADKLPNWFGVEIDRHPAMPGVLAYDRDRVIDVRTRATPAVRP